MVVYRTSFGIAASVYELLQFILLICIKVYGLTT